MSYKVITVPNKQHGPLTQAALAYSWQQLAQRSGIIKREQGRGEDVEGNIPVYYCKPDEAKIERPSIIIVPCSPTAWLNILKQPPHTLDWFQVKDITPTSAAGDDNRRLPVLFWGEGCQSGYPFAKRLDNDCLVFYADIVAATFFMLSRWEETVVPIRDKHDRFPATASVAHKQGFLDRPIVDEYALILQAWLRILLPNWTPQPRRFSVKLSHDIDSVRRASIRILFGDILKRGHIRQAGQTAQSLLHAEHDHHLRGIYRLAEWSEQYGFRGAFYFMAAQPALYDSGYDPHTVLVQRCITDLQKRGHEVGFHPGYHTFDNPQRFMAEKQRMDAVLEQNRYGGRQHYLRFHTSDTWRQWEQAGMAYDSTLSYADCEGFRGGTCHPYHPFDIQQDRQLDLFEIPLIVMDRTLKQYRRLTPEAGQERILTLARRCQQVGGDFTLLWHNNSLLNGWRPWAAMYHQVLARLAGMVG